MYAVVLGGGGGDGRIGIPPSSVAERDRPASFFQQAGASQDQASYMSAESTQKQSGPADHILLARRKKFPRSRLPTIGIACRAGRWGEGGDGGVPQ